MRRRYKQTKIDRKLKQEVNIMKKEEATQLVKQIADYANQMQLMIDMVTKHQEQQMQQLQNAYDQLDEILPAQHEVDEIRRQLKIKKAEQLKQLQDLYIPLVQSLKAGKQVLQQPLKNYLAMNKMKDALREVDMLSWLLFFLGADDAEAIEICKNVIADQH